MKNVITVPQGTSGKETLGNFYSIFIADLFSRLNEFYLFIQYTTISEKLYKSVKSEFEYNQKLEENVSIFKNKLSRLGIEGIFLNDQKKTELEDILNEFFYNNGKRILEGKNSKIFEYNKEEVLQKLEDIIIIPNYRKKEIKEIINKKNYIDLCKEGFGFKYNGCTIKNTIIYSIFPKLILDKTQKEIVLQVVGEDLIGRVIAPEIIILNSIDKRAIPKCILITPLIQYGNKKMSKYSINNDEWTESLFQKDTQFIRSLYINLLSNNKITFDKDKENKSFKLVTKINSIKNFFEFYSKNYIKNTKTESFFEEITNKSLKIKKAINNLNLTAIRENFKEYFFEVFSKNIIEKIKKEGISEVELKKIKKEFANIISLFRL